MCVRTRTRARSFCERVSVCARAIDTAHTAQHAQHTHTHTHTAEEITVTHRRGNHMAKLMMRAHASALATSRVKRRVAREGGRKRRREKERQSERGSLRPEVSLSERGVSVKREMPFREKERCVYVRATETARERPFSLTLVAAPCGDPTGPVLLLLIPQDLSCSSLERLRGSRARDTAEIPTGEGTPNVVTHTRELRRYEECVTV
jgi:hypothetical protein